MTRIIIVLYATFFPFAALAQSKEKGKYIGIYNRADPFKTDTLSATVFFSRDSFLFVYTISGDSDYLHPIYRGTWWLNDVTAETELRFDNGATKTAWFEPDDRTGSMHLYLDSLSYWPPHHTLIRKCRRR